MISCVTMLQHSRTAKKLPQGVKQSRNENRWIRYSDQISARPNRAPYPRIRSCNSVKRLNFSSNSHIWMAHMQKVTNNNHVKFDIHTLDNMEVTRTFMFNLHIQTVGRNRILSRIRSTTSTGVGSCLGSWRQNRIHCRTGRNYSILFRILTGSHKILSMPRS